MIIIYLSLATKSYGIAKTYVDLYMQVDPERYLERNSCNSHRIWN